MRARSSGVRAIVAWGADVDFAEHRQSLIGRGSAREFPVAEATPYNRRRQYVTRAAGYDEASPTYCRHWISFLHGLFGESSARVSVLSRQFRSQGANAIGWRARARGRR